LEKYPKIEADLVDLCTLQPLDADAVYTSVRKTGKLIILQEDTLFGGIASDISAMVMENCFEHLDAPVKRVGSLETPVPFARELEENYLPKKRFETALLELYNY
jgi:2-oxoisovalerate dehydrogenase E1 component